MESGIPSAAAAKPELELTGSRQLTSWLHEQKASLAFTTYQSGKLFLIGMQDNRRLSVFEPSGSDSKPWGCPAVEFRV